MIRDYAQSLADVLQKTACRIGRDDADTDVAMQAMLARLAQAKQDGHRLFFFGNGGSAALCSHMCTDYAKNGGFLTQSVADASLLTCLSNDFSYADVNAQCVRMYADENDLVFCVSSSGNSDNIVKAAQTATEVGCTVITLSGFKPDNRLRQWGQFRIYLDSMSYGFVEIGHLSILHCLLDHHLADTSR